MLRDGPFIDHTGVSISPPPKPIPTMRQITDHKLNGLNEAIVISAGEPGSGNAPTFYVLAIPASATPSGRIAVHTELNFQNGPIQSPEDFNGITNEALLAVLIDRMRGFQAGPFVCRENAVALTKMEEALMWLQKRTRERMARGVEGTLNR
jgi:hypothetical protein